ncbi:MAG: hypothetical protein ABR573_11880 [Candidatus Dormibacteria bacterium]
MAQVAYTQTGQVAWWPAHLLFVASYVLFAAFLLGVSRGGVLPSAAQRVLRFALPIAWFCVVAMLIHLALPVTRNSFADSNRDWALGVKDLAELADGLWALCVAAIAWRFGRTGILGNRPVALLGLAGGIGFALFSIMVPLTNVAISMQVTRSVMPVIPVSGILIALWALFAGVSALSRGTESFHQRDSVEPQQVFPTQAAQIRDVAGHRGS